MVLLLGDQEEAPWNLEQIYGLLLLPFACVLRRSGSLDGIVASAWDDSQQAGSLELLRHTRYALRTLRRNPVFTLVAILILALGIGASTGIFSVLNGVILRTLPVKNPQQIVMLTWGTKGKDAWFYPHGYGFSGCPSAQFGNSTCLFDYPTFERIRDRNHVFSSVFASFPPIKIGVTQDNREVYPASAELVSGEYFQTLGVHPILGRPLTQKDNEPGASFVLVISYALWDKMFARNPSVLGKAIVVGAQPFSIIGVTPRSFTGLSDNTSTDIWLPLAAVETNGSLPGASLKVNDMTWVLIVGRLNDGVRASQARAEVTGLFQQGIRVSNDDKSLQLPWINVEPGDAGLAPLRKQYSRPIYLSGIIVGLLLILASANVSSMLLARSTFRAREIMIRLALGAGHARVFQQFLIESLILALVGGFSGLLVANWTSRAFVLLMATGQRPGTDIDIHVSFLLLVFTFVVSILSGSFFGTIPAYLISRSEDVTSAVLHSRTSRAGWRAVNTGAGSPKFVVACQIALSLILLVGAGLLIRTARNLQDVPLGFDPRNVLLFGLRFPGTTNPPGGQPQALALSTREMLERLEAMPGVVSASLSDDTLLNGRVMSKGPLPWIEGYTPQSNENDDNDLNTLRIGPNFLETMRIPVLLGRTITKQDVEASRPVAVVNQAFCRRYFGGMEAVGKHLRWTSGFDPEHKIIEIVGVVADTRVQILREPAPPTVYVPYIFSPEAGETVHFEVRTSGDPRALIGPVRTVNQQLNGEHLLVDVRTQIDQIDDSVFEERMLARFTGFFGVLGLTLACAGLYGTLSYVTARRTSELGIRMALGGQRTDIFLLIMLDAFKVVVIGVALGGLGSCALAHLLRPVLFNVAPLDPITLAASSVVLVATAMVASYFPALRATRVDPMVALRDE